MEIITGTMTIILGVVVLFYYVISCRAIVKGSESLYSSPKDEKEASKN